MRLHDEHKVDEFLTVEDWATELDLVSSVAQAGALLRGHFELTSGRHAEWFLRFSQIGWQRQVVAMIAAKMAQHLEVEPTVVLCPGSSGLLLGLPLSRALGVQLAVTALDQSRRPARQLEEGSLTPGDQVLIVNDVVTTGGTTRTLIDFAQTCGATAVGNVAFAIVHTGASPDPMPDLFAARVRWPTYRPQMCPMCRAEEPVLPASELN